MLDTSIPVSLPDGGPLYRDWPQPEQTEAGRLAASVL